MTVKLNRHQARVYFTIKNHGPIGPTQIGNRLGFDYASASPKVSRPLKKLIHYNLVAKVVKNKRIVQYMVIHDIDPPIELIHDED